jgi:hypothetical protein
VHLAVRGLGFVLISQIGVTRSPLLVRLRFSRAPVENARELQALNAARNHELASVPSELSFQLLK